MSNVVRFAAFTNKAPASTGAAEGRAGLAPLLGCFAQHRRNEGDAFWLKENAELLGILAATGRKLPSEALAAYDAFHDGLEERLSFFPQYYRMILGIALSLEALGHPGRKSEALGAWIVRQGWIESEVNDLQRAEARYLLARCGQVVADEGLSGRLIRFASRPATFAIPNPRAAYDLLHAVFYLSHYGTCPLALPDDAALSLRHVGTLAFVEQNCDLLAEVCIALHYCGHPAPQIWLDRVRAERGRMRVDVASAQETVDEYHNYLVNHWLFATMGDIAFDDRYTDGPMRFSLSPSPIQPLRELSQSLYALGSERVSDWGVMRERCLPRLSAGSRVVLEQAEQAVEGFDRFFADFSRAGRPVSGTVFGKRVGR